MNRQICIIITHLFLIIKISISLDNRTSSSSSSNSILGEEVEVKKGPYKVLRVYPKNASHLNYVVKLWKSASKYQLNFWKDPSVIGVPVDIMVPPHSLQHVQSLLLSAGLSFITIIDDVKKLIIEREKKVETTPETRNLLRDDPSIGIRRAPHYQFDRYHSYEEMRVYMRSLEKQFPEITKVYTLGFSRENRPIEMIKISNPINATGKKSIWIDAGIHAREWASHTTAIYFMKELVTNYGHDPKITSYVDKLTWYITPCVNPDGYEFTRSKSDDPEVRLWRKNRARNLNACIGTRCCRGVDLNRNFDFHWGESGASDNPCEEIYHGSHAFSEPESDAVQKFITWYKNDIEAVITMHTYSQLWIHPYGHQRSVYPEDVNDLLTTAQKAAQALRSLYGTEFKVGSGADRLYPAAGGSDDWAKSKAGIKYVYLLELRPQEEVYDGFILETDQLIPTARETWEGVKVVTDAVMEKNGYALIPSTDPTIDENRAPINRFRQRSRKGLMARRRRNDRFRNRRGT